MLAAVLHALFVVHGCACLCSALVIFALLKKKGALFSTVNTMQVLHKREQQYGPTSSATFSIDVSLLTSSEEASSDPSPVAIRRVACGPTFVAVLTSKGEVFMAVVTDTQSRSKAASKGEQQEEWAAALTPVARLRGVFVVDIAASAVSIIAVSHIGHVYTLPAVAFAGGGVERAVIPTSPSDNYGAVVPCDAGVPRFQVSAGAVFFIVACREAPSVFAGGLNQSGQLGVGSDDERLEVSGGALREVVFTPPLSSPVRSIHCGGCHTVALVPAEDGGSGREDCSVWVWGRNSNGQLGLPIEEYRQSSSPILLRGVSAITAACGDYFTVLLSRMDGGRIGVCGRNASSQLGLQGTPQDVSPLRWVSLTTLIPSLGSEPSAPDTTTDLISKIACGGGYGVGHTIVTTRDGRVFGCGSDDRGQLGGGGSMDAFRPLSSEVVPQLWAGKNVGASVGWFHSVIWCPDVMRTNGVGASPLRKPSRPAAGALECLPVETLDFIISFLKQRDALSLSATCTLWRDLVRHSDVLWAGTMRRLYPLSHERVSRSLAEQRERAGGFVHYRDGVDFVEELSRLSKERFGFVSGGTALQKDSSKHAEASSTFSLSSFFFFMPFGRSRPKHKFLFLGLDAAGKTSLLYGLKLDKVDTAPIIGFNVETFASKRAVFSCWDVGGPYRLRRLWIQYFTEATAIIYVIDANDRERLVDACQELQWVASQPEARNIPVLVLANKMDLPNPAGVEEVALLVREALDVVNEDRTRPLVSLFHETRLRDVASSIPSEESSGTAHTPVRPWRVQGCSLLLRKGMREGLEWLESVLT